MKAIIQGKRYDTEKATLIGDADARGYSCNDFHYWEEGLYRSPRSGTFFLAGKGGALSRYSRSYGQNGSGPGSKIIPLTKAEAMEWASQYLTPEVVEAAFAADIVDA